MACSGGAGCGGTGRVSRLLARISPSTVGKQPCVCGQATHVHAVTAPARPNPLRRRRQPTPAGRAGPSTSSLRNRAALERVGTAPFRNVNCGPHKARVFNDQRHTWRPNWAPIGPDRPDTGECGGAATGQGAAAAAVGKRGWRRRRPPAGICGGSSACSDSWTCSTREPSSGSYLQVLDGLRDLPVGSRLLHKTAV